MAAKGRKAVRGAMITLLAAVGVGCLALVAAYIYFTKINPEIAVDHGYFYNVQGRVIPNTAGAYLEGVPIYFAVMDDRFSELLFHWIGSTDAAGCFKHSGLYLYGTGGRMSQFENWPRAKYFCIKIGDGESSPVETILRSPIRSIQQDKERRYNIILGKIALPWKDAITTGSKSSQRNDNMSANQLNPGNVK